MSRAAHFVIVPLVCSALSGCAAALHGQQSTSGGTTTTSTSSQVGGSAGFAGGRVAVASGSVPGPAAPGGQVSVSRGSGFLLLGVLLVDVVSSFGVQFRGAAPQALPASISHTCSCYGWKPPVADQREE